VLLSDWAAPPASLTWVLFEKVHLHATQDEAAEVGLLVVARDLLCLLPTDGFSLIVYLCAFFTQVPLCPENGITFEDIGHIFGPPIFGGPVPAVHHMVIWFLKCWNCISDGLLNAEPDTTTALSSSSSPPLSRQDMLVLKHADPIGLLTPDEQEEDEHDFHMALMDPEECRRYLWSRTARTTMHLTWANHHLMAHSRILHRDAFLVVLR
jgi:hypothetical protein